MGNGNTKLNSTEGETETISTKIRPTLLGRFEEFIKRRNVESSPSKKKLLKDAEEEDGSSDVTKPCSHEINETEDHKVSVSTKEETTVPLETEEKISRVVPMENSECQAMEEKVNINKDIDLSEDKVIHANENVETEIKTEEKIIEEIVEKVKKEKELQEVNAKNDDNDSDDEGTAELGRYLCPGSPSFRIYCIEADKRKAEEEKEEEKRKSPTIVMHKKSHSADSVESLETRNTISNEVINLILQSCFKLQWQPQHNHNYNCDYIGHICPYFSTILLKFNRECNRNHNCNLEMIKCLYITCFIDIYRYIFKVDIENGFS
jgi:hypothetical protein